ncbi:MAG: heme-binding domain-containing protein [Chloroflexota bacterium]
MNKNIIRIGIKFVIVGAALFLLIQFLPFGPQRPNPPMIAEPKWDSPQTRALAKRACFDCHSNETEWPWYSYIAPVSWLLALDANNARVAFNFSNWRAGDMTAAAMAEQINSGKMPLPQYLLMHPEARFTDAEKKQLIAGLTATLGSETVKPPATAPAGDAALVQARCASCHGLDRVTSAKKTREQWAQTVTRMVSKGAQLSAAEQTTVIEYLSKTYGP